MAQINFFEQDRKAKFPRLKIRIAIQDSVQQMGLRIGTINYIFCSDEYILSINQEYLRHDTYTDIITFDYTEEDFLSGDIFISMDRITENSHNFKVKIEQELYRVMIHGVLHLAGYADKNKADKKMMTDMEDLMLLNFPA